jgi:hypothetical protein
MTINFHNPDEPSPPLAEPTGEAAARVPLSAAAAREAGGDLAPALPASRPSRRRLPDRRMSLNLEFAHAMQPGEAPRLYQLTIGFYADGQVGEIFLDGVKVGSNLETHLDDGATLASRCLQHGDSAGDLSSRLAKASVIREALRLAAELERAGPEAWGSAA